MSELTNATIAKRAWMVFLACMVFFLLMGYAQAQEPKVDEGVGVQFICRSLEDIKLIFQAKSEPQLMENVEIAQGTGRCLITPGPVPVTITAVYPSLIDYEGNIIYPIQVDGEYYSFGMELAKGA